MELVFVLAEKTADGCKLVRNYTGRQLRFYDRMTAEVLADGLRHGGHTIDVVEIDLDALGSEAS